LLKTLINKSSLFGHQIQQRHLAVQGWVGIIVLWRLCCNHAMS